LRTSGSDGYAGIWRSRAPGGARASSGCSMNPKGATDLSQIRRFPGRSNTLGRRSDASRFACNSACPDAEDEACEGNSGGEIFCVGPGMMCSEGGLKTLEPCTWNQVGRAQASSRPWSFRTSYSSEFEAAEHHGRKDAAGAAMRHGLPVRKSLRGENPRSGSGPSVSARPEGDQTVEGVRNPEDGRCRARQARDNDPSADVAEGAGNPRRGDPVRHDRGGRFGPNPERETKSAGAAGRSCDRTDGRTAEHLVVVQTTRRRRRTSVAATPGGALRETSQP